MKGVFDTRRDTEYDDDISQRYHFPNRYLTTARETEGDWIVYRETRDKGGRKAYVAVARVDRIAPDPSASDYSYAYISDFLELDPIVPFWSGTQYQETKLNSLPKRSLVGSALQGRSVRTISDKEFGDIALAGLKGTLHPDSDDQSEYGDSEADRSLQEYLAADPEEQVRQIKTLLSNRPLRDRAFRRSVVAAYQETCAVTGLRMVNGGGKAEVQAAHIRAVKHNGPDMVQNGIALTATCHWLFDRHLISIGSDFRLLVAHNRIPTEFQNLFSRQLERIRLPNNKQLRPHPGFLEWHRERFLDG